MAALAAAAWLWNRSSEQRRDPFAYPYEEEGGQEPQEITIPGYPYGQGAVLTVSADGGAELTAQEIYRRVNPAVVTVVAQLGKDGASVGTGVIFTEDGYILTNYHVLEGGQACTVYLENDHSYEAFYVAGDANSDLAVLKMDRTGLPAAQFGDSEQLTVGDKVYAIGNPLGYELRGTLTDGIVSAINRDVWVDGRTMNLIQTNAALNSGNSGGPLINGRGQVVGINTIKMSSAYSNIEGLGFAIPSATIKRLVNDLLSVGEILPEPVLGVTVLSLGTRLGEELWGVEVQEVAQGSPAEAAGVRTGDYVVAAGGIAVSASKDLLRARPPVPCGGGDAHDPLAGRRAGGCGLDAGSGGAGRTKNTMKKRTAVERSASLLLSLAVLGAALPPPSPCSGEAGPPRPSGWTATTTAWKSGMKSICRSPARSPRCALASWNFRRGRASGWRSSFRRRKQRSCAFIPCGRTGCGGGQGASFISGGRTAIRCMAAA